MREITFDTETTGLSPGDGHRIVEIGCVELLNHVPTGRTFQRYINPEMAMPEGALAVHGLTDAFLAEKPSFAEVADDFLAFVADSPIIAHNADFDLGFVNAELERIGRPPLDRNWAVDTVQLARQRYPGAPASLDALCKRFQIDLSDRVLHGALKDARLLADVYLELLGGRQPGLALVTNRARATVRRGEHRPRLGPPTAEEEAAHARFLDRLEAPVWRWDAEGSGPNA